MTLCRHWMTRKIAAALACAVVFAMLIVHAAVTYSWDLSGYLSRCFSAPSEGAHGIDSCAPAGWLGGLVVYPLARLTTRIGAIVILSVLFLLSAYLTVWFWAGKAVRAGRRPSSGKGKKSTAEGIPADRVVPQYASPAPRQPMSQMQQPMPPQTAQAPYLGTEGGAVRPEVRQRPGVSLPDEAPQAPSAGYYAPRRINRSAGSGSYYLAASSCPGESAGRIYYRYFRFLLCDRVLPYGGPDRKQQ